MVRQQLSSKPGHWAWTRSRVRRCWRAGAGTGRAPGPRSGSRWPGATGSPGCGCCALRWRSHWAATPSTRPKPTAPNWKRMPRRSGRPASAGGRRTPAEPCWCGGVVRSRAGNPAGGVGRVPHPAVSLRDRRGLRMDGAGSPWTRPHRRRGRRRCHRRRHLRPARGRTCGHLRCTVTRRVDAPGTRSAHPDRGRRHEPPGGPAAAPQREDREPASGQHLRQGGVSSRTAAVAWARENAILP